MVAPQILVPVYLVVLEVAEPVQTILLRDQALLVKVILVVQVEVLVVVIRRLEAVAVELVQ